MEILIHTNSSRTEELTLHHLHNQQGSIQDLREDIDLKMFDKRSSKKN